LQEAYESINAGAGDMASRPLSPSNTMTLQAHEPKFRKILEDLLIMDQDELAMEVEKETAVAVFSPRDTDVTEKRPETPWMQRKEKEVRNVCVQLIEVCFQTFNIANRSKMLGASGGGGAGGTAGTPLGSEANQIKDKKTAEKKKRKKRRAGDGENQESRVSRPTVLIQLITVEK
jgi:hypothetical protein